MLDQKSYDVLLDFRKDFRLKKSFLNYAMFGRPPRIQGNLDIEEKFRLTSLTLNRITYCFTLKRIDKRFFKFHDVQGTKNCSFQGSSKAY